MTSVTKRLNEVSDYVKKFEVVMHAGQAKMLVKKAHNVGNFSGLYSKGHCQ